MALEEYAGAIVMEVDGTEVEVTDIDVQTKTGRKLVKTMNSTGRPKGFSKGIQEIELSVTVVIPVSGEMDWGSIEGAKITIYPNAPGGTRTTYQDCFSTSVGAKYTVENEGRRDIKMNALREIDE
ncbi:phage tail protein [Paraburkholderia unamae]|uniref:Phage tail protein n=1 Tax=Paraburkholderia unamae TaxID=219649 RepID=A0ABX5KHY0_9BURK|nr:phage tail protein [Paraburkholderia unamae]PVX80054.1 hypothetical protein C7402_112241 [Paraburkholderia unamae]